MPKEIIAIGPSLVEAYLPLDTQGQKFAADTLGLLPGGWARAESHDELLETLSQLSRRITSKADHVPMYAGSTLLNALNAFGKIETYTRKIVSTAPLAGNTLHIADIFTEHCVTRSIEHERMFRHGDNPFGLVLTPEESKDRIMINHPGNAHDLDDFQPPQHADIIIVDAYELAGDKIGRTISTIIESNKFRVAMMLGNEAILTGELKERVLSYSRKGLLTFIGGNSKEFSALLGEQQQDQNTPLEEIINNQFGTKVPHILLTDGSEGLYCISEGYEMRHQEAVAIKVKDIISTAGAGDVAFGTFVGGLIKAQPIDTIMLNAARNSYRTLRIPHGLVSSE